MALAPWRASPKPPRIGERRDTNLWHLNIPDHMKTPLRTDGRVIVSYPKSGRTWVRFALAENGVDAMFTHAGYGTRRQEIGRPFRGVQEEAAGIPVVFLHRNPIDTAVSMFYQVNRKDLRKGSGRYYRMFLPLLLRGALPPDNVDAFALHPLYGVEKVCRYNRAWLDHLDGRSDCLVLSYEELSANPAEGFQKLLSFFGETNLSGADLAETSSFERMKRTETTGSSTPFLGLAQDGDPQSAKVRKGKVRGYLQELREDTVEECRRIACEYGFGPDV